MPEPKLADPESELAQLAAKVKDVVHQFSRIVDSPSDWEATRKEFSIRFGSLLTHKPAQPKLPISKKPHYYDGCERCALRLSYKINPHSGQAPILVVHGNRERYDWLPFYELPQDQAYWDRIFKSSLQVNPLDWHHIEAYGCNFSSRAEDINTIAQNCRSWLVQYIELHQIKAVLVLGEAAEVLWGRKQAGAIIHQWQNELIKLPTGQPVPGMLLRSVKALAWLESNNKRTELVALAKDIDAALKRFKTQAVRL